MKTGAMERFTGQDPWGYNLRSVKPGGGKMPDHKLALTNYKRLVSDIAELYKGARVGPLSGITS